MHTASLVRHNLLVWGGAGNTVLAGDVHALDVSAMVWTVLPMDRATAAPAPRFAHTAVLHPLCVRCPPRCAAAPPHARAGARSVESQVIVFGGIVTNGQVDNSLYVLDAGAQLPSSRAAAPYRCH